MNATQLAAKRWETIMSTGYVGQQSLISVSELVGDHCHWKGTSNCLDVGCGRGAFALYLSSKFPDLEVYGLDNDTLAISSAIKSAQQKCLSSRSNFSVANFDEEGFLFERKFDAVISSDAIQHSANAILLLRRLLETWNGKGRFYVSTWTFESSSTAKDLARSWGIEAPPTRAALLGSEELAKRNVVLADRSANFRTRMKASLASLLTFGCEYTSLFGKYEFEDRVRLEQQTLLLAEQGGVGQISVESEC